jgi:hypothetical protein
MNHVEAWLFLDLTFRQVEDKLNYLLIRLFWVPRVFGAGRSSEERVLKCDNAFRDSDQYEDDSG